MKKIIALVCAAALTVSSVFASVEFSINGSFLPKMAFRSGSDYSADYGLTYGGGFDLDWFFVKAGKFDFGFSSASRFVVGNKTTIVFNGVKNSYNMIPYALTARLGHAVRFNLNDRNSFVIEP